MKEEDLARDPTTNAATLRKLASGKSSAVRALVAANPNATVDTLMGLVKAFPEVVLSNPTFSLALLAEPALLGQLSKAALASLAGLPSLPPDLLREIFCTRLQGVWMALASNPATPPDLLVLLATDASPTILSIVLERHDLPLGWAELLRKASAGVQEGGPRLEEGEMARLLSAGPTARWLLTQQQELPVEVISKLLESDEALCLQELAVHHGVRVEWAERVVDRFIDAGLGRHLVDNPCVSPRRWFEILSRKPELLADVLGSRAASEELLASLARGGAPELRAALASSLKVPAWCLDLLGRDPDPVVRQRVAASPNTEADALWRLAADPEKVVLLSVASSVHAPAQLLDHLGCSPVTRVRQRVAANPGAPAGALRRLAADPEMAVRIVVARHPSLPGDSLAVLAADPDAHVRRQAEAVLRGDRDHAAWTPAC